jgi:hypothetical protein
MQREITYEWSPEFVRLSTRRFLFRYARRSFIFFLILFATGVCGLVFGGGPIFWWLVIGAPVFCVCFWLAYYGRMKRIREEMPDPRVTLRVEPESITFQTSERCTTLKWSAIKRLWSDPDVLFLFTYDRQTYTAVPVAALGTDLRRYIEEKVREHGNEVA